ncbi:MAG: CPBP family intramembrane metalloprotease [Bacteroidetes bacterium]|nr:CPBP family intramembrane metalloprotease [Bacteroidota bacterium]MBS1649398.1 CPBP family intramembrane metalloprotease [Bacteroidota bacterium]
MNEEEQQQSFEDSEHFQQFFNKKTTTTAISYAGQLGILIGLLGAALIIGSLITGIIFITLTHTSLFDLEKTMANPAYANASKIAQLIGSVIIFFVPAFFYARIVNKNPFKQLGFSKQISIKQIFIVIAIAIMGLYLSGALARLNETIPISKSLTAYFKQMEDKYSEQVLIMANMKTIGDYLFSLLVIALIPAIVEETLFRGGLQNILVKWTKSAWIGIVITSIIFSAIHFSYYGFLSRAMLGMVLGFIFYETKNLWLNILMHFINNGVAITGLYFIMKKEKVTKEALNDDTYPIWIGAIALLVIIYLFQLLKKETAKQNLQA